MPKILIREYDNSTTATLTANNFAVVVPGYFGNTIIDGKTLDGVDINKILIDQDVYEITSQADFIKYIGKCPSITIESVAPILVERFPLLASNSFYRYAGTVSPSDFDSYHNSESVNYIYEVREISDQTDPRFGKSGYLLLTAEFWDGETVEFDDEGNEIPVLSQHTYEFIKINAAGEIEWTGDDQSATSKSGTFYVKIKEGNEGKTGNIIAHSGNQIAYELLGLGYTVLFKRIDPNKAEGINQLKDPNFWAPLKDKSVFNFRYIMTGGFYDAEAMNQICQIASFNNDIELEKAQMLGDNSGRGDCIALCDIDESNVITRGTPQEIIESIGRAAALITKADTNSAIFGPRVTYVMPNDKDFGNNKTFPASFHYLACAAKTFERYAEWYAVAGYNRGISSYTIESTSIKLGEIAVNTLAPRVMNNYTSKSLNLILHERGNYYIWGNRTAHLLDSKGLVFHHFLNIRQLCTTIKKQLYTACRQFTFDPNSDLLWINFCNAIRPTLEAMKADQGIKGYKITKVAVNKKALLTAKIRIVPIEAVEDFDISISLEDSLTGIKIEANETEA